MRGGGEGQQAWHMAGPRRWGETTSSRCSRSSRFLVVFGTKSVLGDVRDQVGFTGIPAVVRPGANHTALVDVVT